MKEVKVYEFDPVIYPRLLWVSIAPSLEVLNEHFLIDGPADANPFGVGADVFGCVTRVILRRGEKYGALMVINKRSYVVPSLIAHEAVHVADLFFEQLGIEKGCFSDGNESYAYLVDFVVRSFYTAYYGDSRAVVLENPWHH